MYKVKKFNNVRFGTSYKVIHAFFISIYNKNGMVKIAENKRIQEGT